MGALVVSAREADTPGKQEAGNAHGNGFQALIGNVESRIGNRLANGHARVGRCSGGIVERDVGG